MGGKRGRRELLITGVYQDCYGIGIPIRGKEHRYPLGTPLDELAKARRELLDEAGPSPARRGTLAADAPTYLATLPADITSGINRRRRKSDATRLLDHWIEATVIVDGRETTLGALPRNAITPLQVKTQLTAWLNHGGKDGKPLGEITCNNRRLELSLLYTALNGKEGYNPVRAVPKFGKTYDDPRGFDLAALDAVIELMPNLGRPRKGDKLEDGTYPTVNLAKIRLRVMRECGIPPQTLKRVEPHDIRLAAKELTIRPRRKGKGAKGRVLPLTSAAAKALRAFVDANAFGWFDQRAVNRSFKRAVKRYRAQWALDHPHEPCPVPADLHAYDLRHGFLSDLYRQTKNPKVVSHLAGHAPGSKLADRYVQSAADDVAKHAVAQLEASKRLPRPSKKSPKRPRKATSRATKRRPAKSRGKG